MSKKPKKSSKHLIIFSLTLLFIAFILVFIFIKNKNIGTKSTRKILTILKTKGGKKDDWKVYENNNVYFKYPEDKQVHDTFGGPTLESKNFELYGKSGQITMMISILSIPEDTNKVFNGEISTKVLAEKSRSNKIRSDVDKEVLDIRELSLNDLAGYSYDFDGNYSAPYGTEAGFTTDNNCSKYRVAFLKDKAEIMVVVYCLEEPYTTIFDSIRLK